MTYNLVELQALLAAYDKFLAARAAYNAATDSARERLGLALLRAFKARQAAERLADSQAVPPIRCWWEQV